VSAAIAIDADDRRLMRIAIGLAQRGLGNTWPNPAVGCALARDGVLLGRGWTQPGGRPHAETEALGRAGAGANGATAYVTLEPCSHHGQTPPCAEALIAAGVERCVVAAEDPDKRVAGRGLARLKAAGIQVELGVLADEAREVLAGYFMRQTQGRPLVTLKLASTLDGRIATKAGESRWITGEAARARGHLLRARHDAVMIGIGTALADDPELTCRLPGTGQWQPVRIVLDSRLRLPSASKLAATARATPTWLVTGEDQPAERTRVFRDLGVEIIAVKRLAPGRLDLPAVLAALGGKGITAVLAEGGGNLAAALLGDNLVDRLAWFRAPRQLGGDAVAAIADLGIAKLAEAAPWRRLRLETVGDDVLETLARPL
jgi:diaminohydroxyphosphoribosylaminopyrimidine deaminase / 5-amino-6-(5-phosphoribosylamino)uracil reductase